MQEKINHITVNSIEYPLVFNLNVMELIQEKYGSIEKWGELTDTKGKEPDCKALKFGITEMINEGIDIENEILEVKREPLTTKQVGRIITELGITKMAEAAQNTVIESAKIDDKSKNV